MKQSPICKKDLEEKMNDFHINLPQEVVRVVELK